jgi:phenylalanyl-tRNA synthetase beta chain
MNLLASYNWLKEYVKTDLSPEEFAKEFSLRSMSVETIDNLHHRFDHMVVGVVQAVDKHPDADRLRIVSVDLGNRVSKIVCGGSNVVAGMKVLVAGIGAKVRWHGAAEWTTLEKAIIRGVESDGMICAGSEIGFDKLPSGEREIWDLTNVTTSPAGTPIAEALDLSDAIFDIEVTTNRPDAMGMIGLAREASVAIGAELSPTPYTLHPVSTKSDLSVTISDKRCKRYMAAVVENVKVGPSPWWMQKRLLLAGSKPINTIVDITNYVLLELGQPMHAFDASMISGNTIVVRKGKKGEKLTLLDGKEVELSSGPIVIADGEKPLALAGIMGGKASGTTENTTTVVFEAAMFDGPTIRRSARTFDTASDSQLLFEKGLSPNALPVALARAIELAEQIAGGTCVQTVDVYPKPRKQKTFTFKTKRVRERIGVEIPDEQQVDILTKLGFGVTKKGSGYAVTVPYWREDDIENEVDFTEEVARMYGYHNMPAVLPASRLPEGADDVSLMWEGWTKRFLASLGFTEFFSNSLVSMNDLECFGVSPKDAIALMNPLTADLTHLRPKLVPSVLRAIERNQAMVPAANVFELGRIYIPREGALPEEQLTLVIASYGVENAEAAFMHLRGVVEAFALKTGLALTFERRQETEHWHAGRSVNILHDGKEIGILGQIASSFQDSYGIHRPVFMARIILESLIPSMKKTHRYQPVPVFPAVVRDIAVLLDERTEFAKVHGIVCGSAPLITRCDVVETYRGEGIVAGKKSVTISVTMMAPDRTLTSQEVDGIMTSVAQELSLRVNGTIRS